MCSLNESFRSWAPGSSSPSRMSLTSSSSVLGCPDSRSNRIREPRLCPINDTPPEKSEIFILRIACLFVHSFIRLLDRLFVCSLSVPSFVWLFVRLQFVSSLVFFNCLFICSCIFVRSSFFDFFPFHLNLNLFAHKETVCGVLIKNAEDTVVFLTQNIFNSDNFLIAI